MTVAQRNNVVQLRPKRPGKVYAHDPIFFVKEQIKVGATLIHVGRIDPSAWIVSRIVTTNARGTKHPAQVVEKFSDRIYIRRANGTPSMAQRSGTFGYFCYSAVWRVG